MSSSAVFSFLDLTECDHEMATCKYVGSDIKSALCICSTTTSTCSLLAALVEPRQPAGYFIVTIHDIMNPIDYSNGSEPSTKFIRAYRNEVFLHNGVALILLNRSSFCVSPIVASIFALVAPERVVVLDSIPKSQFIGETAVPRVFVLGTGPTDGDRLPPPNALRDAAAAILAIGLARRVPVTVWQAVQDAGGPSAESIALLGHVLSDFVAIDVPAVAAHALNLAKAKLGQQGRQ
jgi:hypothetical protein